MRYHKVYDHQVNKCPQKPPYPFVPHYLHPKGNQLLLLVLPIWGFYVNGIERSLFLCMWLFHST